MPLTKVDHRVFLPHRGEVSPYDYGAKPGTEMSVDNTAAIQNAIDAAVASWDNDAQDFLLQYTGHSQWWRQDSSITLFDAAAVPGFVIKDCNFWLNGLDIYGFDVTGANQVTWRNCRWEGDSTNIPYAAVFAGRETAGAASPYHVFDGCEFEGYYSRACVISLASEVFRAPGTRFRNKLRGKDSAALILADNPDSVTNRFGALPTTNPGGLQTDTRSNIIYDLSGIEALRQADYNLVVTDFSQTAANPVITVSTGTLAAANMVDGDEVFFHAMTAAGGKHEANGRWFTVTNIDTGADTFELVDDMEGNSADSSGYSALTGGFVSPRTGPAIYIAGAGAVYAPNLWPLTYGYEPFEIDLTNGTPPRMFYSDFSAEKHPPGIVRFINHPTDPVVIQGMRIHDMSAGQDYALGLINIDDTGVIQFHGLDLRVYNADPLYVPDYGFTQYPAKIQLIDSRIAVPDDGLLTAAASFSTYYAVETVFNRSPAVMDYRPLHFTNVPTIITATASTVAGIVQLSEDGASPGPLYDLKRISASPAAFDSLASLRWVGKDSGGNDAGYAQAVASIVDPTDGSEDGRLAFWTLTGGTLTLSAYVESGYLYSGAGNRVQTTRAATAAELADITHAINTTGKAPYLQVYDTTNARPVYAVSNTAGAVWRNADGTLAHTPV